MAEQATIKTAVSIDVSSDGIKFSIEGLDTDLANLIEKAGGFHVLSTKYHTYDTSDVVIISDKVIEFVDRPVEPPIEEPPIAP